MGNNLSPFLAEIFLANLESQVFFKNPIINTHFKFYRRYVDDIFVVFEGDDRYLDSCFKILNSAHKNVRFTVELEHDRSLNFLDLSIERSDNKLNLGIYRKPTTTSNVIHFTSHHPLQHKLAAFRFFFHRLYNFPLNINKFNDELRIIHQIALHANYAIQIIKNLQHKILFQTNIKNSTFLSQIEQKTIFFPLP